jgi:hypothetical protein
MTKRTTSIETNGMVPRGEHERYFLSERAFHTLSPATVFNFWKNACLFLMKNEYKKPMINNQIDIAIMIYRYSL